MPRRRAPGEGSIYQRKSDSRWVARVPLPQADGTTRHKYLYADTQRQARQSAEAFKRELAAGRPPSDSRVTLRDYLNQWLTTSKGLTVRPSSIEVYRWAATVINQHLGGTRLADLRRPAVQQMIAQIAAELEPRSVSLVATVLRMALAQAVRDEVIPQNPAAHLDKPRIVTTEAATLTPEQVRILLAHTRERSALDAALYALLVTAGARISEALGLTWADLDLDAGLVHFRRQLAWPPRLTEGGPELRPLKTSRSRRRIPLLPATTADLRALRASRAEEPADHLVFVRPGDRPDRPEAVRVRLRTALARCGLPLITTHELRHTNATWHLEAGTDIATISKLLGHASTAVTTQVYAHVTVTLEQAAVARLGGLLAASADPAGVSEGVTEPSELAT